MPDSPRLDAMLVFTGSVLTNGGGVTITTELRASPHAASAMAMNDRSIGGKTRMEKSPGKIINERIVH
ncbi:hypothetical protein D3C78_1723460 [compost metagenome]